MPRITTKTIVGFGILAAQAMLLRSTQPPNVNSPLDVATLRAAKSGANVVVTCSDGISPFQFISNATPKFSDSASFTSATNTVCTQTYTNALTLAGNVFYLIADTAAGPTIPVVNPVYGQPGDAITLRGTNLDGATLVAPDGQTLPITFNSRDTITFTVPALGMPGGYLQVYNTRTFLTAPGKLPDVPLATNLGAAKSPFFMPHFFVPPVNNDLFQVAYYKNPGNTTHIMAVSGREGATNPRIYIMNVDTRGLTTFSAAPRSPMGMSIGTLTDGKAYLFYGSGQPLSTAVTLDLNKLDFLAAPPVQTVFRRLTSDMTLDTVNVRATSFVSGDATNENSVFAFNPISSTNDIRQAKEITPGVKPVWANYTWGSNTANRNYPGGLGVRGRAASVNPLYFYVSDGLSVGGIPTLSRVQFWSTASTGNPPTHTKLWTADLWQWPQPSGLHPIVNAAQITLEPFAAQHAFVADLGNISGTTTSDPDAISQIHKINTDNCISSTSCTTFVSSFNYGKRLLGARGVAVETGLNGFGNAYSKWLWVSQQLPPTYTITGEGVSRIRALRELPIQVILTTNAGWSAANKYQNCGAAVSWVGDPLYKTIDLNTLAQFTVDSVNRANEILYQVGYQISFDPTRDFKVIDDSSIPTPLPFTYRPSVSGSCSPELSSLVTASSLDPKRIPIFIVHAIGKSDSTLYDRANGVTVYYTSACNGANWITLINPVSSGIPLVSTGCQQSPRVVNGCCDPTTYNTFAHELYHRLTMLLSSLFSTFGFDATAHKMTPCPNDLMCGVGSYPASPGFRTSGQTNADRDDDFSNSDASGANSNPGSTLILPDYGTP